MNVGSKNELIPQFVPLHLLPFAYLPFANLKEPLEAT